jgi:hypothetical protein
LLLTALCLSAIGRSSGFSVSCPGSPCRLLTRTFHGFPGLSSDSFGGLLRFFSDSFRRLLGFLTYGLGSFFDFLPRFLRFMLDLLDSSSRL